jgi:hypothetical protein
LKDIIDTENSVCHALEAKHHTFGPSDNGVSQ